MIRNEWDIVLEQLHAIHEHIDDMKRKFAAADLCLTRIEAHTAGIQSHRAAKKRTMIRIDRTIDRIGVDIVAIKLGLDISD